MKKYDLVILTDDRFVAYSKDSLYTQNVLTEDRIVREELERLGIKVEGKSWSDPYFDWSKTKYIVFKTTWDYFDRYPEFLRWLDKVCKQTQLMNSEKMIRWNIDKHYFLDLKKAGIHFCETHFIEKGSKLSLSEFLDKHPMEKFVVKPCVSSGAFHTYKVARKEIKQYQALFQQLLSEQSVILQPFQDNIVNRGEVSLVVINGVYTHAILKKAKEGDFRVQDDYGGTVQNYIPSSEEIAYAEKVVKYCPEMPIYARVDVFLDNQNKLALAELELIEPELWFRNYPKAADQLAQAIQRLIKS